MNRIDEAFKRKRTGLLSVYLTAGFPELENTLPVISALAASGVDMIEIGMPFSDPLADGPVLQKCNQKALDNGMSVRKLFEQLREVRSQVDIPLVLMGYMNPVLQFGMEEFCKCAVECGIDGVILPDMPISVYEKEYKDLFEQSGLHMIFLITPQTKEERIVRIASLSRGFIYMVSAASTTGMKSGFDEEQMAYFTRIRSMGLELPRMIGFGISTRESFQQACEFADGAIIGSAFMKHLSQKGNLKEKVSGFISQLII